ncbi:peptidylprolyl isomerase [Corallibacter vietnamensis]|uniref:peptidylprolyl isomerase n=1 Tax=Corallibacter vietnamensis TaxID=904130 RepID=A0ABP7H5U9_9FLAO
MKILKNSIKLLALSLLISFTSCSQQKYPDLEDGLYAEFVTNKGTMVAKLFYKEVPATVANFVALAEGTHPMADEKFKNKKYFNGLTFHRVMDKFMIQGGDPDGNGMGGPGYKFTSEFDVNLRHDKPGILSMANSGGLDTNGSQFFITEVPYPSLDAFDANGNLKPCENPRVSCHGVFGELVIGLDVQDTISNVAVSKDRQTLNKPLEDVIMTEVNIIRKGADAKAFDAAKVFSDEYPNLGDKIAAIKEEAEKKIKESAAVAADSFIKKYGDLGTVKRTETGLVMIFTEKGTDKKPTSQQKALIDCAGYFVDGRLFYTTKKDVAQANNQYNEQQDEAGMYKPFAMPYNETAQLVPGFRESMLNMNIGDKVKAFIPSYLGYGASGRAPMIPPNTNLIFDIELVGIDK